MSLEQNFIKGILIQTNILTLLYILSSYNAPHEVQIWPLSDSGLRVGGTVPLKFCNISLIGQSLGYLNQLNVACSIVFAKWYADHHLEHFLYRMRLRVQHVCSNWISKIGNGSHGDNAFINFKDHINISSLWKNKWSLT